MILNWFVIEPQQVVIRVDNITSSSTADVKVCWSPPQVGDVGAYELNIAYTASDDVGPPQRRQIWVDSTDTSQHDNVVGGRHCHQLDTTSLPDRQLHSVFLRPWTTGRRPGMSVVALFSVSGL